MRIWRANLRSILLAIVMCGGESKGSDVSPQQVRTWVLAATKGGDWRLLDERGVVLTCELRVTTTRSQAELDRRWQEIERLVDHPERQSLERQRELIRRPEVVTSEMWYSGPTAWLRQRVLQDGTRLAEGGLDEDRWTRFVGLDGASAVNIVRSGVPCPVTVNASRYYDVVVGDLDLLLNFGMSRWSAWSIAEAERASDGGWVIAMTSGEDSARVRIKELAGSVTPRFAVTSWSISGGDGVNSVTCEFEGVAVHDAIGVPVPRGVVLKRRNGLVERYSLQDLSTTSIEQVRERGGVPELGSGQFVRDFRREDSPDWQQFKETPRAVWTLSETAAPSAGQIFAAAEPGASNLSGRPSEAPTSAAWRWVLPCVVVVALAIAWRWRLRS